jgi:hypothetical protein
MATPRLPGIFSRRAFIKLSGAIAGVAGAATERLRMVSAAPGGTRWVYYLDPDCGTDPRTCAHPSTVGGVGCAGCKYCQEHAKNKRWADPGAVRRAHACCRCTLKKQTVAVAEYERLFGKGKSFRREFDARWAVST